MPQADAPGNTRTWEVDELGPMRPLPHVYYALRGDGVVSPQYSLFHYLVLLAAYAPYLGFLWITGQFGPIQDGYPFGFADPVSAVQNLLLIARGVSTAMAAGAIVVVYFLARRVWSRGVAKLAAILSALLYPMFYYARTSNVDVPALFWFSWTLLVLVASIQEGLTVRRAMALGVLAAFTIATKDQYYAPLSLLAVALAVAHLRAQGDAGLAKAWKPLLTGTAVSVAVYGITSGLFVSPRMYFDHIRFITSGSPDGRYFRYLADPAGFFGLATETAQHMVTSVSGPLLGAAVAGIFLCFRRERWKLVLLLPLLGVVLGVVLPVRHVALRFLIPGAVVMVCYAAAALYAGWQSKRKTLRVLSVAVFGAGCATLAAQAFELTGLLRGGDPRYAASEWFAQNGKPGDRVEFFSTGPRAHRRSVVLPRMPAHVELVLAEVGPAAGSGALRHDFVITVGPHDHETHRLCPQWVYRGLQDGSLGYVEVASFQNRTLFHHPFVVNDLVKVFARADRAAQLPQPKAASP